MICLFQKGAQIGLILFIWTYKIKWYMDYNLYIFEKTKR